MTERHPILIDCDTGIDDSLALLYACASPEAEIVAVTCVSGNIDARTVADNTRAVLELGGRADVEVALGREVPLVRELEVTPETHGPRGLGYAVLPPARRALSDRHAADLIVAEARRRPGEITLVTLGPLTNLALAVLREPDLPGLLRGYVLMGGSYRSAGNTAPTTEWNIHCDPDAAKVVFRAWADAAVRDPRVRRPLAVGLDVTERVKMTPDHLVRLARRAGMSDGVAEALLTPDGRLAPGAALGSSASPIAPSPAPPGSASPDAPSSNPIVRYLADSLRFYMEFHSRSDGFYGAFVHDPFALAAALDPSLVRTEAVAVDVELGGALTTGETVTDWRRTWGRPPNLDVAVAGDADVFLDRFIERVGMLAADPSNVAS